ncbi:MAG TPA: UPF0175 family protein [Bryobacteraceae bacterium]|nr:UPF0175 family protein [Bryobacteraceae bacterium]
MRLTVEIPDDLAARLSTGGDLSRRALEAWATEEYRVGHLTRADLSRLLGFETRFELDDFLKARQVHWDCTLEELERDVEALQRSGL